MMVTECEAVSVPLTVQPGDPGTVALENVTVLGAPFVQLAAVAPPQVQGDVNPIQIMTEEVLVGRTIQGVPLAVSREPHAQSPGSTATLEITAVAPLLSMLPVISTEQVTVVAWGCETVRLPLRVKFETGLGVNVAAEAELATPAVAAARAMAADRTAAHLFTLNSPRVVITRPLYLHQYKLLSNTGLNPEAKPRDHRPARAACALEQ